MDMQENDKLSAFDYRPTYFIRCHSRVKDDRADIKTRVWGCAFEPDPKNPSKVTSSVATCGANSVCITNVKTGEVIHKYFSEDINEEFYTIAWTTLLMKQGERQWKSNILAVAGRAATVHFIHPDDKVCFRRKSYKGTRRSTVSCLLFHPLSTSILFVSFSDGKILILDIGQPSPPDYESPLRELHTVFVPVTEVIYLTYSPFCEVLLAATDDGLYGWRVGLSEINNNFDFEPQRWKFTFPRKPEFGAHQIIDSVEIIKNGAMIASKCALYGEIYVWDLGKAILTNEDMVDVKPDHFFKYSDTDNYYMVMGSHPKSGLLCCGDDKGRLWLYNVCNLPTPSKELLNPSSISLWPIVTDDAADNKRKLNQEVYDIVVNKTTMNHNGKYLVAVTSTNLVCVWKREN